MKLELLDEYLDFFEGKIFSSHRKFIKSIGLFVLEEFFNESLNNYINLCPSMKSLNEVEIGPLDVIFLGSVPGYPLDDIFIPFNESSRKFNKAWEEHLINKKDGNQYDIEIFEQFSEIKYGKGVFHLSIIGFLEQDDSFLVLLKESTFV